MGQQQLARRVRDLRRRLGHLKPPEECWADRLPSLDGLALALGQSLSAADEQRLARDLRRAGGHISRLERVEEPCAPPPPSIIYFLVDISESMAWTQDNGTGEFQSLLDMVKEAIRYAIASIPTGVRAGLISYFGGLGAPCTSEVLAFVQRLVRPTENMAEIEFALDTYLSAAGNGPLAHGLTFATDWAALDGGATIIILTDGAPNMTHIAGSDFPPEPDPESDERFGEGDVFDSVDVVAIPISDGMGGWRDIEDVRVALPLCGLKPTGEVAANVMEAALYAAADFIQVNPVVIKSNQDGDYFTELMGYAAAITNGTAYTALTLAELKVATLAAIGG